MAELTAIKQSEAPRRPTTPRRQRARMAEYEDYVASLKRGQASRLIPSRAESLRGVALRVSRAGKRLNRPLETWTVDGAVYFRLNP